MITVDEAKKKVQKKIPKTSEIMAVGKIKNFYLIPIWDNNDQFDNLWWVDTRTGLARRFTGALITSKEQAEIQILWKNPKFAGIL